MTLEEIGSLLGITRERVRQIKEKALEPAPAREPGPRLGELPGLGLSPAGLDLLPHLGQPPAPHVVHEPPNYRFRTEQLRRLEELDVLPHAAHVIRNAGGRARDALRSLIISQRLLGTREVAVVHHTDCGMLTFSNRELRAKVQEDLGQDTGSSTSCRSPISRAACGRTSSSSRRRSCSIRRRCFGDSCTTCGAGG